MPAPVPTERILRFDAFELDVRAGELRKNGTRLRLQGQPLQVLAALARRPGELVTREELRHEIWSADTFVDFDHSLHNAIARIRETLGDSAESPRFVETLPRRGYRFLEKVEGLSQPELRPGSAPSHRPIQALAVLPLSDLSGEQGHEYFADGMTEALITSLAKIKALRIISRTSVMQYKGVRKSLPQIARELNVDAVIEGSVIREGQRVRITAQLIEASTDQHLWAESYERDFRDVLSLQSAIAREIAGQVHATLTPQESERLTNSRRVNPEAHEQYLMGRYHWNKRSESGVKKALVHFQRAIEIDPTYAHGYAGLADSYNILGYYNTLSPNEAYTKGKAAAQKALALDDTLAEPYASIAVVKRDFEWDWTGAMELFRKAIELNPGYTEAYHWRSTLLCMLGRSDEALQEKAKALAMDPLSVVIQTDLARMYYFNRDYDRAIKQYRSALEMDPNFSSAHLWLAFVYEQTGEFDQALAELEIGKTLAGDSIYAQAKLGQGLALAGKERQARSVLEELVLISKDKYVSPYDMALIHLGLNEKEMALARLEEALEHRSIWMGYLKVEPQWDAVRDESRFQELLKQVGLN